MKKFFILATSFLLFHTVAFAEPAQATITKTVEVFKKQNLVPGISVEYFQNGSAHSLYLGHANLQTRQYITGRSIFEIASITKLFTAILLAEATENNKISLSDTVAKYLINLKYSNPVFNEITVENLLTHTSGLPFNLPKNISSQQQFQNYFASWYIPFQPGSQRLYSNVSFGLAGEILKVLYHKNYNQIFRSTILKNLKMFPIGFTVPRSYQYNVVQGYNTNNSPTPADPLGLFPAASGIRASSLDMQNFLKACLGLSPLPSKLWNAIKLTETPIYQVANFEQGLGWEITSRYDIRSNNFLNIPKFSFNPVTATLLPAKDQTWNANALLEKTGAEDGFRSYIGLIPAKKSGVVILTNKYVPNEVIVKLGRTILQEILHK